jgi:3-methyl-2-oxobutanoate hydroxymethyltransferase
MLGFFDEFKPKFVKRYLNGAEIVREALKTYTKEVENKEFPTEKEIY